MVPVTGRIENVVCGFYSVDFHGSKNEGIFSSKLAHRIKIQLKINISGKLGQL